VGVEVDQPDGSVHRRAGADVGLGDRMIAAEHERQRAGVEDLADGVLDGSVGPDGVGGQDGGVAEVDHPQLRERIDAGLQVRAGDGAGGADRPRAPARPRSLGHELVHRRADDRHVDALQLGRILRVRQAAEAQQPRVVGLLADMGPASLGVKHQMSSVVRDATVSRRRPK
jgi:hypothetical protein